MKYTDISKNDEVKTFQFEVDSEDYQRAKNTAYLKNRFRLITNDDLRPSYEYFEQNFSDVLDRESAIQLSEDILEEANKLTENQSLMIKPTIIDIERSPEGELLATVEWVEGLDIEVPELDAILEEQVIEEIPEPTEEEITEMISNMQKENARLIPVEEPITEDHTVSVDLTIFADDQEISKEENLLFTLSDENPEYNRVIFDNDGNIRFLGHQTDDVITISLAQPSSPNAYCEVKINQVYNPEYPELDDDFASEISEFDTYDEFKDNLVEELKKSNEEDYWNHKIDHILHDILSQSELTIDEDTYNYMLVEDTVNQLARATAVLDENFIPLGLGEYKHLRHQAEIPFAVVQVLADDLGLEIEEAEVEAALESLPKEIADSKDFFIMNYNSDAKHLGQLYNKDEEELVEYILLLNKVKSEIKNKLQ